MGTATMERLRLVLLPGSLGALLLGALVLLAEESPSSASPPSNAGSVFVVAGAPGEEVYGESFRLWLNGLSRRRKTEV